MHYHVDFCSASILSLSPDYYFLSFPQSTRQELSLVGAFEKGLLRKHIHVSICRAQILEEISH